jgi:hypothetical protein
LLREKPNSVESKGRTSMAGLNHGLSLGFAALSANLQEHADTACFGGWADPDLLREKPNGL